MLRRMFPLESGQVLCSRFTLLRPLGRGGMGQVWLASDRQLDEEVVTKIVPADASAVTIELLRHECRNTRRLSHPNIVRVFDFHQCDGVSFITMEHITGESIETLRGAPIEDIVQTLAWLAGALDHAHQAGVVHRDVKAGNVLLDRTGQPRLTDFGIAAVLDPGDGDLRLEGGGSRYSMSPQQAAGDPPQPSDDIYGLGTLAYHLISGHPPFWSEGDLERIQRDAPEPFDPQRGVPSTLQALVDQMLAESTADRPAHMAEVRRALEEINRGLSAAETQAPQVRPAAVRLTPPPKIESRRPLVGQDSAVKSESRARLWSTVAVFLVLGALVLGVFLLLPGWVQRRSVSEEGSGSSENQVAVTSESRKEQSASVSELSVEPEIGERREARPETVAAETTAESTGEPTPDPAAESVKQSTTGDFGAVVPSQQVTSSDVEFRRAMSAGLTALEASDFPSAKQAFQRALELSPGSSEVADGLGRAEEGLRLAAIAAHRSRAEEFERQEDWSAALREYDAVFGLDPTIRFAREGKARAEVRSQLAEGLEDHIAHPDRLSNDEVLESAERLLSDARSVEPPGPVLRRQIDSMTKLLAVATTPIRVELVSDNLTEVTVYRVGLLGRFTQQVLDLRPGTYTVVGSRAGYRDVRHRLTVSPSQSSKPVEVRCLEEI